MWVDARVAYYFHEQRGYGQSSVLDYFAKGQAQPMMMFLEAHA